MKNVMFVAMLCCCLLITTGTDGEQAGNVQIENCNKNVIDIQEHFNNTILCKGFNERDTIAWTFKRTGSGIRRVATCNSSNCTVHQPDHFAVERSPSHSTLFYQQYDRQVDKDAIVTCHSHFQGSNRSMPCNVNVINPAKLSSCTVEEDRAKRTVRGRCRFDHAYSDKRGFLCIWYRETDGKSLLFPGEFTYTGGSQGPSGFCNFTRTDMSWEPGTYTYSIDFYPGPGKTTVNVSNKDTSPKTPEENDLPVGAIVGGIMAVVAVIGIIVVVVVLLFYRRKRKQKPAGRVNGSGDVASKENNDFEEHVNPMYVTSDDPDDTYTTDHKPSAIALRISLNSHNGHPAGPHSLDADMYTTVDGEGSHVAGNQASGMGDRSGGYEDIGLGNNGNQRVPQKDEYAVVDKSRAKERSSANTSGSSPAHTTEGSNEYSVVDKSSSRNKAAKNIKVAEPETEGAAYAQVQKPKPSVKPKTSTKPSSDKDVRQHSAADDDEYHTLSHTRGSPHTQDQADLESHYSHIGHD